MHVVPLLPARLSTDPEGNIELAIALCESPRLTLGGDVNDVDWLLDAIYCREYDSHRSLYNEAVPDSDYWYNTQGVCLQRDAEFDAFIVAQRLAMIADALASKAGR